MQQKIAQLRDDLSKREHALRSITGKVTNLSPFSSSFTLNFMHSLSLKQFHFTITSWFTKIHI